MSLRVPLCDKPRLLLVDDDASFCEVLARALDRQGFDVLSALDSDSAVALAVEARPAFAVVDLRIGEDSGLDLVQALVRLDSAMRVVVLTAYASIATAIEAIKLGAVHYLAKPAEPEAIVAALSRDAADTRISSEPVRMSPRRLEWEHLQNVLREHDGNVSAAARALGLHRRTLQRKLHKRPVRR